MNEGINRRQHTRVPFAFAVSIDEVRAGVAHCQRIATAGLYAYTPHVLPSGEEVRLSVSLPNQAQTRIVTAGRVLNARREDAAAGTLGGMQLLFQGLDPLDEEAIRDFVLRCIQRQEEYSEAEAGVERTHRRVYQARFFGTEAVSNSYVVDISEGGIYVRTLTLPDDGEQVFVDLYLPGAGAVTRVDGEVVWRRSHDPNTPGRAGVGIRFRNLPPDQADLIGAFVGIFGAR